jgi:hypothetical protein
LHINSAAAGAADLPEHPTNITNGKSIAMQINDACEVERNIQFILFLLHESKSQKMPRGTWYQPIGRLPGKDFQTKSPLRLRLAVAGNKIIVGIR